MNLRLSVILVAAALASSVAQAGENERVPPVGDPTTAKECGECHIAFQPALLPVGSWMRIMDQLRDHFGDDASLPGDVAASIRLYLAANASRTGDPQIIGITGQPWFIKEHRLSPSVWQRPEIRTKSNCLACHPHAEQGMYEED